MRGMDCVVTNMKITPTDSTEVFTVNLSSNSTLNGPRRDLESQVTKDENKRHSIWWTLGIDIPLLIVVLLFIGLVELSVIPSHKYGFYCNDPALSFKFTGETVNSATLISTAFLIPLVVFLIAETILFEVDYTSKSRVLYVSRATYMLYRIYIYGILANLVVVEVMKTLIGAPRPTFFDLCAPETDTGVTCNGSEFVTSYVCTSSYSWWLRADASRSFPSGHTSLSVYCGLFIAWYLQIRAFNWRSRTVFVVPALQMLCASYTVVCSLTRITDHRHHWWDVLVGAGVGFFTVVYAVYLIGNNFSFLTSKRTSKMSPGESRQTVGTLLYDERQRELVS